MCGVDPASEAGKIDWRAWLARVLPSVDLFLPSLDETLAMLGREPAGAEPEPLRSVGEELLDMGASVVVLKLGDDGLYLRSRGEGSFAGGLEARLDASAWRGRELYAPCFEVEVAGTTGAGDCTIAGFLAGVHRGAGPEDCVTLGAAVGGCSVEAADATSAVPPLDHCINRLKSRWPARPPAAGFADWPRRDHLFVGDHDAHLSLARDS
jgi:sugar/nucleoside kinase (ribokinase family)